MREPLPFVDPDTPAVALEIEPDERLSAEWLRAAIAAARASAEREEAA